MIKSRISEYLELIGVSKYKFYKDTGLSNGFLDKDGAIGSDKCEIISSLFPELSLKWLITGKGEMRAGNNYSMTSEPPGTYRKIGDLKFDPRQEQQNVPLYDITGTASIKTAFDASNSKMMPIDYLKIPNMPKCDFAMYMTGDSMYPALKAGDILAVKEVQNKQNIIWGQMYVVSIVDKGDEYLLYKYVQKSERKGYITLVSENKHHQPVEFPLKSIVAIGLIKVAVRFNTAV